MDFETINFLAVPVAALLAALGGPWALRKAGYPAGKITFGTLALTVSAIGLSAIVTSIQRKTGTQALPLAWAVPAILVWVLPRMARRPD